MAVFATDAERLPSIGHHGRIDFDPRVDPALTDASCEFCAQLGNSVRRTASKPPTSHHATHHGMSRCGPPLREKCSMTSTSNSSTGSAVEDCHLCSVPNIANGNDANSRGFPWTRGGLWSENIQAHLLRLKAKSKALQIFPKKEQNELHRSDSFKFQKYERDRSAAKSPKIIVDDEYALPVDLIVRYSEENGKRQIYVPTLGPHHELNDGPVGLLGNYCDPLDCKSYVDPGEEEKIYLCDESLRGDCNGCDGTYIQPETCQPIHTKGVQLTSHGEGRENCVRIEVPSPAGGKLCGEFERKPGIRLSPGSAQVFQRRLQTRVDGNSCGKHWDKNSSPPAPLATSSPHNRDPSGAPPLYENVTWVAVTPPTSLVNESTDDDDQLSCEEGEFIIDLPCFCPCCQQAAAVVADVSANNRHIINGSGHTALHRSHSALVLSVPTHGVCCSAVPEDSVHNCWCSSGNALPVNYGNLVRKPPLPRGVSARVGSANMCFRQAVDPEDDVHCMLRVPAQPQNGNSTVVSEQPSANSSHQPGKDGSNRKANKLGIRSLLLRQSQPKRLFLSPAKPGRIYCPNGDANRNRHYFQGIAVSRPPADHQHCSSPVQIQSQENGPLAASSPIRSFNGRSNSCGSNHRCDVEAILTDQQKECGSCRSPSKEPVAVNTGDVNNVKLDLSNGNAPSPRHTLCAEASSSESSSPISSLESVRSSASSASNGNCHLAGSYSTYLCQQRVSSNGGSPLPATTEVHVDFKPPRLAIPSKCLDLEKPCINSNKRNTWMAPQNMCIYNAESDGVNLDDLANLPFEMPKLQRKLEQLKRHSWNEGDAAISAPMHYYACRIPTIAEPETDVNLSTSDLEGSIPSDKASPVRPRRRSDLQLKLIAPNYELPHIDVELPLERQGWYHGAISRRDAENLLRVTKEGSFLVRNSESSQKGFSLSLKSPRGFMHMRISEQNKGEYVLGEFSKPFDNIPAMVYHYVRNRLPIKGAEHMSLRYPVIEQLL